ncbi:MAG TPA: DUF4129 domain-containing protein [Mucilaginibacter sp.]|nr:DUF4129 domain-containing protein [Mucilaginibacter sp.]
MPKLLLTFLFSLITGLFLYASASVQAKKAPAKLRTDSSAVVVKNFNAKALKAYYNDKNFNYNGPAQGEASAWDRFWAYFWDKLFSKLDNSPLAGSIIKYTFLIIAIGLLVYFIFRLMGMDAIKLLQGEARKTSLAYTESLENIHELNFDSEIEKAVSQHNYRLAVRLLYLKCLKQLSDSNLIHWQIDKTNSAYVLELNNLSQRQAFLLLTRQFEYVWYGGFTIDGTAFQNINQLFQNFKKQLP